MVGRQRGVAWGRPRVLLASSASSALLLLLLKQQLVNILQELNEK